MESERTCAPDDEYTEREFALLIHLIRLAFGVGGPPNVRPSRLGPQSVLGIGTDRLRGACHASMRRGGDTDYSKDRGRELRAGPSRQF